jgi:hypothetical protein
MESSRCASAKRAATGKARAHSLRPGGTPDPGWTPFANSSAPPGRGLPCCCGPVAAPCRACTPATFHWPSGPALKRKLFEYQALVREVQAKNTQRIVLSSSGADRPRYGSIERAPNR